MGGTADRVGTRAEGNIYSGPYPSFIITRCADEGCDTAKLQIKRCGARRIIGFI